MFNLKIYRNIGKNKAEIIEDRDTYPETRKVKIQIGIKMKTTFKISIFFMARPINTPALVAIPFPPLKFRNAVQLCPHMLARPKINLIVSEERLKLGVAKPAMNITGIMPLEISSSNPKTPILYPAILAKLVAPILPDPDLRKSTFFTILAKINEKGMEPKR